MNLVWLGQEECHNLSLTGGKAANLSRLAADYPVPHGFCLTTAAIDQWTFDRDKAVVPPEIRNMLEQAYLNLAQRCCVAAPRVAVRSSAAEEDSGAASFAGQYETLLNIIGTDSLINAVVHCRASAFSERVQNYRIQKGREPDTGKFAVLVQQMIPSDISAVAFSINPVTGNKDEILINAAWGLGESIVSGRVTPDAYLVRKSNLQITEKKIAQKERMTVMAQEQTREVIVPRIMSSQPVMTDIQIIEIAQMALSLEQKMGWHVDIECALEGAKLYLVQCRPVTSH